MKRRSIEDDLEQNRKATARIVVQINKLTGGCASKTGNCINSLVCQINDGCQYKKKK